MDEMAANHAPAVSSRQKTGAAVLMSLEDDNGLMETRRLLRSPRNAWRLLRSIAQAKRCGLLIREPVSPDRP